MTIFETKTAIRGAYSGVPAKFWLAEKEDPGVCEGSDNIRGKPTKGLCVGIGLK